MVRIFFDMDGVLANFLAAVSERPEFNDHPYPSASSTDIEKKRRQFWSLIENTTGFWENMPEIEDTKKMVKFAYESGHELFILSLVPNATRFRQGMVYVSHIKSAKKEWVLSHFGDFFNPKNIIITDCSKAKLIKPIASDILIDDVKAIVDEWISYGGKGILFSSVDQAMEELSRALQIS